MGISEARDQSTNIQGVKATGQSEQGCIVGTYETEQLLHSVYIN